MAGDPLVGLAERLQGLCLGRGVTVALAESCTGGLVADAITDVAGSSGYFAGGVVSYSNDAKESLLAVPGAVLAAHGAVSAQVARAMAEGTRPVRATVAASVTGIAGARRGTEAKPVGLTYVAVADAEGVEVRRRLLVRRPGLEQGLGARPRFSIALLERSAPPRARARAGDRGRVNRRRPRAGA